MKRSSCLSAMLVGLSVVSSSVAFAAPASSSETEASAKPVLVAQAQAKPGSKPTLQAVQGTDPAPSGGTTPTPADPSAAPSEAAPASPAPEATVQPAVTLGTAPSAPATDTPQGAAEEPKKKPKPRPWAGTNIYVTTSMTTATIFKGQQQDYNPTVDSSIWLLPRYALSESFQLRGRLIFSYEYTNSDTTVTRNEPRFSDTTLSLFYRKIPKIPGVGIKPMVAINAGLPTSPESRARTLVVSPGATVQLSKEFEHFLGGELMILSSLIYSHPLYRYQTPERRVENNYAFQCFGGNACQDQLSGLFNPSDTLAYTLLLAAEWGKWSPALYYLGSSQWAYTSSATSATLPNGTVVDPSAPAGFQPTNVRQTSYFSAWLDYNANAWFTAEVGYWLSRSALDEAGQRGNPFFDRYQDMRVYIGANFSIDNIMKALEGGETEAGIVRAKAKTPMWNF